MTILTRQERERLVRELYNQGKTYREISKEARISPRDIGVILNKVFEEKSKESKEEGIKQKTIIMMTLRITKNRNSKIYLYQPKLTNSFLKIRLH